MTLNDISTVSRRCTTKWPLRQRHATLSQEFSTGNDYRLVTQSHIILCLHLHSLQRAQ